MVRRVSSGSPYETSVGYSRAVAAGDTVHVSGSTSTRDGRFVDGDAYAQAQVAIGVVTDALAQLGLSPESVVRTRMYVTDMADAEAVGRAHAEVFGDIRPAATMVAVPALIDPRMRVEIEADAYAPGLGA
jgi:enamine deaminase RidA (YjgF/YER057c/UK114 family)